VGEGREREEEEKERRGWEGKDRTQTKILATALTGCTSVTDHTHTYRHTLEVFL